MFGVEFKAVSEVPKDGLTPAKKDHRFSLTQVKELTAIQNKGGGVGLGMIACGSMLFWFTPEYINEHGQVDCNRLLKEKRYIMKTKEHGWAPLADVFELLWADRMGGLLKITLETNRKYFNQQGE